MGSAVRTIQPDHSNTSDRQLRAVIDTIPALVWLANTEGARSISTGGGSSTPGYTGAGRRVGWTVAVHPEDVDRLTNYWRSVLQSGVRGETEARLRRVDGEYGWFKFTAEPLHDQSGTVVGCLLQFRFAGELASPMSSRSTTTSAPI